MQRGPPPSLEAESLAAAGRIPEALLLLSRLGAEGDGEAMTRLAAWKLRGRHIPRDRAGARALFGRAGDAGRLDAAVVHANFVANGTGGPGDWAHGLELLRALAERNPRSARELGVIEAMAIDAKGDPLTLPEGRRLSETPHVELFEGFMTKAECDYLIKAAAPMLEPSVVVDPNSGRQIPNPGRTSEAAGFSWPLENPAIHAFNRRIAALSSTDVGQGEPLQVLRYRPGQEYKPHFDAIPGFDNQRILTVLVYLNQGYKGGETLFATPGLKVKGKPGDAILFRNVTAEGRPDRNARHAGLPVRRGEKLIASKWVRAEIFDGEDKSLIV